jgi:para-aminobenzoate synthetase/4-amino-4-deoxychorismate lyase
LDSRLEQLATAPEPDAPPLLWFGIFDEEASAIESPDPAGAWLGKPEPLIRENAFREALSDIHRRILAGDVYQTNFTFQSDVRVEGDPLAIYEQLKGRARACWGAVVFTGRHWILSCSPELFFTVANGEITARPMKGTAAAGSDPQALLADEKQRAENLMIVDLMRNDLSRVCRPGSVKVPDLFTVESFPTLLQMTSTVVGRTRPEISPLEIVKTIFPCGSVTGAPKVSAMEIIHSLEDEPRGPYTGSIGFLSDGDAQLNVAIRTLVLSDGSARARLGLGSGIVADSSPEAEWRECLAKGAFIPSPDEFELIETMRVSGGAIPLLELHLDRLGSSSAALDFRFDRRLIESAVQQEAGRAGEGRLKLSLFADGRLRFDSDPLPRSPASTDVRIVRRSADSTDFRLRHKTSLRDIYDAPLRAAGSFEILFVDPDGFLTEGSFTNIFMAENGVLVTPPRSRGLLPGVLRRSLIESGQAVEADIHVDDLTDELFVGNAVRGLIAVNVSGDLQATL